MLGTVVLPEQEGRDRSAVVSAKTAGVAEAAPPPSYSRQLDAHSPQPPDQEYARIGAREVRVRASQRRVTCVEVPARTATQEPLRRASGCRLRAAPLSRYRMGVVPGVTGGVAQAAGLHAGGKQRCEPLLASPKCSSLLHCVHSERLGRGRTWS